MRTHLAPTLGRLGFYLAALVCVLVLSFGIACSGGGSEEGSHEGDADAAAAEEPAMEEDTSGAPRIWFVTPEDGATVASPVAFEFGSENITIEPKGDVHENAGHHHIGLNTDCLPPGTAIPEADPWVHFGDASNSMEMQLPPGEYKFTIQIGDGEHVTLDEPGLCTSISINVTE